MPVKKGKSVYKTSKPKANSSNQVRRNASKLKAQDCNQGESFIEQDDATGLLMSIEWDAAEALAQFCRMAHLSKEAHKSPRFLQWCGKRRRSARIGTEDGQKKSRLGCKSIKYELHSEQENASDELESSRTVAERDKESLPSVSKADSPSSPLPSAQLSCKGFSIGAAESAFQKVVPLRADRKPCLFPVNVKIEETDDMCSNQCMALVQKAAIKRIDRKSSPPISSAEIKIEELKEEVMCADATGCKFLAVDTQIHRDGYQSVNMQRASLAEMEKEARRLRRVQANRESARQTVRRKQIQCEELARRAACLHMENEGMKQRKQMLIQELYCLKGWNSRLRQQLGLDTLGSMYEHLPSLTANLPDLQLSALPYQVPSPCFVWAAVAAAQATNMVAHPDNSQSFIVNSHMTGSNQLLDITACVEQRDTVSLQVQNSSASNMSIQAIGAQPHCQFNLAAVDIHIDSQDVANVAVLEPTKGLSSEDNSPFPQISSTSSVLCSPSESVVVTKGEPQVGQCLINLQGVPFPGRGYLPSGRSLAASIAAAEARRRRKELMRSKFLQSRTLKLAANLS